MTHQTLCVLVVDDEPNIRALLVEYLYYTHGYHVDTAPDAQAALAQLEETQGNYDVVLLDNFLIPEPGQEPAPLGVALTKEIKVRYPGIEIIVITGQGMEAALEALRAGAYRYVTKPLNFEELNMLIQTAAEHRRLKGAAREKQILEQLMKTSTALLNEHSLPEMLDIILQGVQAIGFDRVCLYLLSEDSQTMVGQAQVGLETAFVGHKRPVSADVHMQRLLTDPRPHVFEREDDQPLAYEKVLAREEVNQWACVPLIFQGKVIGKLSMDNKVSQRSILAAELGPVALFASQAAAAIENAQLYKEVVLERDRSEWMASQLLALHEIAQMIQAELDPSNLLNLIAKLAAKLLKADAGGILLLDDEKEHLTFQGSYRLGGKIVAGTRDLVGGSIAGRVVKTGGPIIANDIPNDSRFYNPAADGEGLLAIVSTPLSIGGEIMGTLDAHSKSQPYAFNEDDLQILSLMATQAAIAIQNAKLFEQKNRRAVALETLHRVSLDLTSRHNLPELVTSILDRAAELLQAKGGCLYLLDTMSESGEQIKLEAVSNRPDLTLGMTRPLQDDVVGRVIKTRAPLSIADYRNWPHRRHQYDSLGFTAMASAPIVWQDKIWGAMAVHDDLVGRRFTSDELSLLVHLGNLAAVALENADLATRDADKLHRLEQLAQANSQIMSDLATMSLNERLNLIAKHATKILNAEAGGVFMVNRPGFLSLEASYGHRAGCFKKGKAFAICSGPQTGLTGHIACQGKLFNARGGELNNHFAVKGEKSHTTSKHCYSLLAIPLNKRIGSEEKLIGLLRVDNKKNQDEQSGPRVGFTQEDEWILSLFVDEIAVAIEGAELVAELSKQKDHWARLVASSPNGVISTDRHGNITGFNEQAQKILKYQPEEVLNKSVKLLFDDPKEPGRIDALLHLASDSRVTNYETYMCSKGGERIPIRQTATRLYDTQGNRIGGVGYFEDLRSIKEAQQRLEFLFKASNIVAQAENLTDGLQSLAEMMVSILSTSFCHISLLDESQEFLVTKAAYPHPTSHSRLDWEPGLGDQTAIVDWPGLRKFLAAGRPSVFKIDDEQHQLMLTEWSQHLGLREIMQSVLAIPLRARDRNVGLLYLGELRSWERSPFSIEKQKLIIATADQTTALIDRLHLHEITERRRRLLTALDEASRHIRAEKETFKLLQEVVRLAVELVGCTAGGLYINHPRLKKLELHITYELPPELIGYPLSLTEGLIGYVAQTGQTLIIHDYCNWPGRERIFEPYNYKTVVGIPLKQAGEVEAVLFVADDTSVRWFDQADLEILERFAAQASIALQTSRLISREQRMFRHLAILHKISDYIQAAADLDKMLHVVLTGVTAGYGLGFNRAALFLLDERGENLVGRLGVGHLDEAQARKDWEKDREQGLLDIGHYLKTLEQNTLPATPIDEQIRRLRLPVKFTASDIFSQVVLAGHYVLITQDEAELDKLPGSFIEAFEPDVPLIVAPLQAREQVIGLLIADNKFTRAPITDEDIDLLLTFANTAAIAIDNTQLFHETEVSRERLSSLFEASNAFVSFSDPEQVLQDIVEQACVAAGANGVNMMIIDQMGSPRYLIAAGRQKQFDLRNLLQPNGVSMRVMRTGKPEVFVDTSQPLTGIHPSVFWRSVAAASCLPVSLAGKRIGVMWLDYDQPRHFSEAEIEALQLYANHAAIAYDSARLLDQVSKARNAAQVVAEVTVLEDLPSTLNAIVKRMCEVLGCDVATLRPYDPDQKQFDFLPAMEGIKHPGNILESDQITAQSVVYNVLQLVTPYVAEDTETDPLMRHLPFLAREGIVSSVGIPLVARNQKVGVLFVGYRNRHRFTDDELTNIRLFAYQAAVAIRNAQLYRQVQKRAIILQALYEAGRAITGSLDFDEILTSIAEQAWQLTSGYSNEARFSHLALVDGNKLTFVTAYPAEHLPRLPRGIGDIDLEYDKRIGIAGRAVKTKSSQLVSDVTQDPDYIEYDPETHSELTVPIKVGEDVIGIINVEHPDYNTFNEDDQQALEALATQAAIAIQNAQLFEETQRRASLLSAAAKVARDATAILDIDELLRETVRLIAEVFDFYYAGVFLLDDAGEYAILQAVYPKGGRGMLQRGHKLKVGEQGIIGHVTKTGQPHFAPDVKRDPYHLSNPHLPDTQSEMVFPLIARSEVIGALDVQSAEVGGLRDEDIATLQTMADQLANAIHNAQLYQQATQRLEEANALLQAAVSLTGVSELKKVLELIMDEAMKLMGTEESSILFWDPRAERFTQALRIDENGMLQSYISQAQLEGGRARKIIDQKKPIAISDARQVPGFNPAFLEKGYRASLGVPLLSQGEAIGVLYVRSNEPRQFSERQIALLAGLAGQAAVAIHRAGQYETLNSTYKELRHTKGLVGTMTAVSWMGTVAGAWRHNIGNLSAIIGDLVELIRLDLADNAPAEKIKTRLVEIEETIKEIQEIPMPPLSSEEGVESVYINRLINERIAQFRKKWGRFEAVNYDTKLSTGCKITVRASPEWLRRVIDVIINNAVQAMAEVPNKQLTITTQEINQGIKIAFADIGTGIPENVAAKLFKKPIKKQKGEKGSGLGLFLARTIIETYGGTIGIGATGSEGTTVLIWLPTEA